MRYRCLALGLGCALSILATPVTCSSAGTEVALLRDGRAFVPLRSVAEWMGAEVTYRRGVITATRDTNVLVLAVGRDEASIDGRIRALDAPPFRAGSTTFVPLRTFADAFGARVAYDQQRRTATIRDDGREAEYYAFDHKPGWLPYMGAWFAIQYPAHLSVVEREKSASGSGFDGVSFVAEDASIELYVFSPQWRGESRWARPWQGERELARSRTADGSRTRTQFTYHGPAGAYTRRVEQIVDTDSNTNHCFGVRFTDAREPEQVDGLYLRFKNSLEQYAD